MQQYQGSGYTVAIEEKDGKSSLVIRLDLDTDPKPSATGKTLGCATTHGNRLTTLQVKGQFLQVGVNAYIKNVAHSK